MRRLSIFLAAVLLAACSSGSESTIIVPERLHNPGLLVVPRVQLDIPADYALVADSGPIDAERYAEESLDDDDTGSEVEAAGYVRGYDLVFEPTSPTVFQTQRGHFIVGTAAFEWIDDDAAEEALLKIATDLQDLVGDESDGVRLVSATPFAPTAEVDSAVAYRTEWEIEGVNPIYQTVAYGRFGKMIGASIIMTFEPDDLSTDVGAMLQQVVARSDLEDHESPDVAAIREYLITVNERNLEMSELVATFFDAATAAEMLDDPAAAAEQIDLAYEDFRVEVVRYLDDTRAFTVPPEAAHAHDLDLRGLRFVADLDRSAPFDQQLSSIQSMVKLSAAASEEFGRLTAVVLADEEDPLAVYLSEVWTERREVAGANQRYAEAIEGFTSSPSAAEVDQVLNAVDELVAELQAAQVRWAAIVPPPGAATTHQRSLTLQRTLNAALGDLAAAMRAEDIDALLAANAKIFETVGESGDLNTAWTELELEVLRATGSDADGETGSEAS
jgi:hypothetical protein